VSHGSVRGEVDAGPERAGGLAAGHKHRAIVPLRLPYRFTTSGEAITAIELIADPERLRELDLTL
jgi:hypothetical protein